MNQLMLRSLQNIMLEHLWPFCVCSVLHYTVVGLRVRFGLPELRLLCEQYAGNPGEQEWDAPPAREPAPEPQQSLADTQFLELLRSMWEHEDGDSEEVGEAKRGTEGEGEEEDGGNGEINEDIVNEDELNEIYEFAATQRKIGSEAEVSTEEEEEDDRANNCSDAGEKDQGEQNVKVEEATDMPRSPDIDLNPEAGKNVLQSIGLDTSLDRTYDRLFCQSWGEYTEPSRTQTPHLDWKDTPTSRRTSTVSEVIDLSISPPLESGEPARLQFPVTGMSPGEVPGESPEQSKAVQQALTSESPNAQGISQLPAECSKLSNSALNKIQHEVSPSPLSSTKPRLSSPTPNCSQPELIVLSDSSDDMDLPEEVPSRADAPRPPTSSPSRLSRRYTHMKSKETTVVGLSPKQSNLTMNSVHPEPSESERVGSESVLDGSAEVSWLIPATPEPSTRTSSTQTSSSMRRTQLFPRCGSSSSSSISANPKTTSCSNSLRDPPREHSKPSPAFQNLITSHSRSINQISVNQTYPDSTSEPCSSTPLHSDPRPQRLDPLGSPLLRDSELRTQRRADQEGRLGSLCLSPSENLSSPRLSHSSRVEKASNKSPARSQDCENAGETEDQEMSTEDKEPEETGTSKSHDSSDGTEEGLSFVFDEPPIAFDDSWGLGGAVPEQGPCFSLRLESSADPTSPPEQSGQRETVSLNTFCPPERGAQSNLPNPGGPHNPSLPAAEMWDSWKEDDEPEEEVPALPLSQRLGAVALAKRVSQLRTPGNQSCISFGTPF